MADAATITLKAVLLPDEIQTTLKDLTFSFTPSDANDKWYYKLVNVRHNASSDLIEGNYLSKSTGVDTASTNAIEISSGHSWFAKLPNTTVGDLHAISADPDQTVGEGNVQCIVAAILDDISA